MSTSFYGSLPESTTSDNAKSVPIPITSTVTRTYVEYTSSPEISSVESAKKFTRHLDEADLDFEKTFQQQAATVTTTTTTKIIQSSSSGEATEVKESSTTVQKSEASGVQKDGKLWDKPLGELAHVRVHRKLTIKTSLPQVYLHQLQHSQTAIQRQSANVNFLPTRIK